MHIKALVVISAFTLCACSTSSPRPPTQAPQVRQTEDWNVLAHVTAVDPSYLPLYSRFQIDESGGYCNGQNSASCCYAGMWLHWNGFHAPADRRDDNILVVHELLVSALLSGNAVQVYGMQKDSPGSEACEVRRIILLDH